MLLKVVYKGISADGIRSALRSGYLKPQYARWPGEAVSMYFTTNLRSAQDYALTTQSDGPGLVIRVKNPKVSFEPDPEGEKFSVRTFDKIPVRVAEVFVGGRWVPAAKYLKVKEMVDVTASVQRVIDGADVSDVVSAILEAGMGINTTPLNN